MADDPLRAIIGASKKAAPALVDPILALHVEGDALALQQAESDLADIATLRKTPAFERYYLRDIRRKAEGAARSVLEDEGISPDVREVRRKVYLEMKELTHKLDDDEAASRRIINDANRPPQEAR